DAQSIIWGNSHAACNEERIAVRDGLHRVLSTDIVSPMSVPSYTNSAVDGYAVNYDDLTPDSKNHKLPVAGTAWAGRPYNDIVGRGQAIRIMTGALMPDGCDTVIMQEDAKTLNTDVIVDVSRYKRGHNVRKAGEDLVKGTVAISKGTKLKAADLGLLASLGIHDINVYRKLRVAFFSTGNELRSVGQPLQKGEIYDSNRYTLLGMLQSLHMDIVDLGVVSDDRDALMSALATAARQCDAVITSGGVSVGDADFMREAVMQSGHIHFWQVAMKPGRPLAYGTIHNTPYFGLPGNPVAVMVTFYQLVQPSLLQLSGVQSIAPPPTFKVRSASTFRKRPGRTEFQRAILKQDSRHELQVHSTGMQGSGILQSMSKANCFVVLDHNSEGVNAGEWVDVQPFNGVI
ncbi:MAG: molybdopterin molybdotransferase MoeA, partial [Gammaproteobacteria bacterium]